MTPRQIAAALARFRNAKPPPPIPCGCFLCTR